MHAQSSYFMKENGTDDRDGIVETLAWIITSEFSGKNLVVFLVPPARCLVRGHLPSTKKVQRWSRALNRQFTTAALVQPDRSTRRLMQEVHNHHQGDPNFREFDERGVAEANRKVGFSIAQRPNTLTVLHHLSLYCFTSCWSFWLVSGNGRWPLDNFVKWLEVRGGKVKWDAWGKTEVYGRKKRRIPEPD